MKISLKVLPIFLLLIGCVANQEVQENINNNNNPSQANAEAKKTIKFVAKFQSLEADLKKRCAIRVKKKKPWQKKAKEF